MNPELAELTAETDNSLRDTLLSIEREMERLQPEYEALRTRLIGLRMMANSMRGVLGMELLPRRPWTEPQDSPVRAADEAIARAEAMVRESEKWSAGIWLPTASDPSSTEHVVELLREQAGTAVTRRQILAAFRDRGWIVPSWRDPEAAVRMAIRRAETQDSVERVSSDSWLYRPDSDDQVGGDA
jgi:hypothetical protein